MALNNSHIDMVENFKQEVELKTADAYMLTVSRDGESPVRSIYFYDNALDAATGYTAYSDWGFARDFLTVTLYEPTGKVHSKTLYRPRGGECTFERAQYYAAAEILKGRRESIGLGLSQENYNYFVYEFAKLFSKDNQRFQVDRFLEELGYTGEINDQH